MPKKAFQDPEVIRSLRQYRLALIAREEQQTLRLAKHWLELEKSLNDQMLLLAFQIKDAQATGSVITEQLIRRMERYQALNNQMKKEILKYANDIAVPDIEIEQREFGKLAIQTASEAIQMTGGLGVSFNRLPVDAVETFVGHLGDGTPLYRLLKEAYPDALDGVVKALLEGSAKGLNPNTIAYNMARDMGMGLERITLIARTEQLRVSRLASAEQYRSSGLDGVMKRVATKDDLTCPACLALDGEIIPLDQELDDHPRGRCVAVFQVKSSPQIQWEKAPDWFAKQDQSTQEKILGNQKYQMWKNGDFKFTDLARKDYNATWGNSPRTATLKELQNA